MRFTSYLAREWAADRVPTVATPIYVRDDIHVSLLSLVYRQFCESLPSSKGLSRCGPSGYVESQGSFAHRVSRRIAARTGWSCEVVEARQTCFPEPLIRCNASLAAPAIPNWDETVAWDDLAEYYSRTFAS
jgi:hypothetical protein